MTRRKATYGFAELIGRLRQRLIGSRDAFILAILGLAVGICAGAISIAFRASIELSQVLMLPPGGLLAVPDGVRAALPLTGMLLAAAVLYAVARGPVPSGVVHVLQCLVHTSDRLPLKNAIVQFVAGALVLTFGMSMGREGPAIHLGAASGSLIGERLRIAGAAVRSLIGCGVAAALGAAFNTPLAGIILAIEVVLIEYTVGGFAPVLLAAVAGATLGRSIYGDSPAFDIPDVAFGTLWELPYIVAMGIGIGAFAAAFTSTSRTVMRYSVRWPWWSAMLVAGLLVGIIGLFVPQVLGIGYDVIELILKGEYGLGALVAIAALKLFATAIGVGVRAPAGLIGPTLVMGAACGSIFGIVGTGVVPHGTSNVALYSMLGMAAMMGATLHAPLSALVAVLELTGNPHIILPGMLAIMSATLAARHVFDTESIFTMQLLESGLVGRSA
jgi:CIC family chloride channel protein